jgi:hypothetical protein
MVIPIRRSTRSTTWCKAHRWCKSLRRPSDVVREQSVRQSQWPTTLQFRRRRFRRTTRANLYIARPRRPRKHPRVLRATGAMGFLTSSAQNPPTSDPQLFLRACNLAMARSTIEAPRLPHAPETGAVKCPFPSDYSHTELQSRLYPSCRVRPWLRQTTMARCQAVPRFYTPRVKWGRLVLQAHPCVTPSRPCWTGRAGR